MRGVAYPVDHGWEAVDETKHVKLVTPGETGSACVGIKNGFDNHYRMCGFTSLDTSSKG